MIILIMYLHIPLREGGGESSSLEEGGSGVQTGHQKNVAEEGKQAR